MWAVIVNAMINAGLEWVNNVMTAFYSYILGIINAALDQTFWNDPYINLILNYGFFIGCLVLAVSMAVVLLNIAEESGTGKRVEWASVFLSFVRGVCFLFFGRWIAEWSMQAVSTLTGFLNADVLIGGLTISPNSIADVVVPAPITYLLSMLFMLVVIIAFIMFLWQSIKRFGLMLFHILQIPLYIPAIIQGDTSKLGAWLTQMVAIALTYGFQYVAFYLGAFMCLKGDVLLAFPLWIAMGSISKILNRFGWSGGGGHHFGQVISSGMMMARLAL